MPKQNTRLIPGQPIKASVIARLAEFTEALLKLGVSPPLDLTEDAMGRQISDAKPLRMWVKLVGAANPYDFNEVVPTAAHGWSILSGGRADSAYEVNSVTGLDTNVVQVDWTAAKDWRFYFPRIGTVAPCATPLCVTVKGCNNLPLVGASVTISNGSTFSSTGTTVGVVSAFMITNGGVCYTSAPTVSITGGGGTGATATCTVGLPTGVCTIAVTGGGAGYGVAPTVGFTGGGGSGATATASVVAGVVTAINVITPGTGYLAAPTVSITGGGGAGATATAAIGKSVITMSVTNPGTGYTSPPTVSFSGGGPGAGAAATAAIQAQYCVTPAMADTQVVTKVQVTSQGSGYTSAPTVAFSGGGGTGAAATAVLGFGISNTVTITNGGAGYTGGATVVFSGGGGSGATGTVTTAGGVVTGITVTAAGNGYTSAPTVTINPVTVGAGATATSALLTTGGKVVSVTMTSGGSGYTSAPTVGFSGGAGTGAAGTAHVSEFNISVAAARFATQTTTIAFSCLTGGSAVITLLPDSTHACFIGCVTPVNKTLTLTDSSTGLSGTATYSGIGVGASWNVGFTGYTYPGINPTPGPGQPCSASPATNCPPSADVAVTFKLAPNGLLTVGYSQFSFGGFCPSTYNPIFGYSLANTFTGAAVSCPPAFSATFTGATCSLIWVTLSSTVTWTE